MELNETKKQLQRAVDKKGQLFKIDKISQGFGVGVVSVTGVLALTSAIDVVKMLGLNINTSSIATGAGLLVGDIAAFLITSEAIILAYSLVKAFYDYDKKTNADVNRCKKLYFVNAHKNSWYGIRRIPVALRSIISVSKN